MQPWEMRDLQTAHERLVAFVCKRLGHDLSDVQRIGDPEQVGVFHEFRECRNCHKSWKQKPALAQSTEEPKA